MPEAVLERRTKTMIFFLFILLYYLCLKINPYITVLRIEIQVIFMSVL